MAVPQFIRIVPYGAPISDPPTGATSGRTLVEIFGGGFRTAPPPPPGTIDPKAPEPRTVEVLFGGVPALRVAVPRSNLLRVVTPPSPRIYDKSSVALYPAEPSRDKVRIGTAGVVDVTIRNLDDAGVPIPGEEVVAADAWTYINPPLNGAGVSDTTLLRVVRAVLDTWQRDVWPETYVHQSIEYDSDGTELRILDIARLPNVVLLGPRTVTSRLYEPSSDQLIPSSLVSGADIGDQTLVNRMPYGLDLIFDVVGQARERMTVLNLAHTATVFVQRTPRISVPRDPSDPSKGSIEYQFGFASSDTTFDISGVANASDLHSFRGSVAVRGVLIDALPLPGDGGIDAVPRVDDINVNTCPYPP